MTKLPYPEPPLPRHGEILRFILNALDLRGLLGKQAEKLNGLADGSAFSWYLLEELSKEASHKSLEKGPVVNQEFPQFMLNTLIWLSNEHREIATRLDFDSLRRQEALPFLILHLWCGWTAATLLALRKDFGGPELGQFCQPEVNPFAVVMGWAEETIGSNLVTEARGNTIQQDQLRRWRDGKHLPEISSIMTYCREVSSKPGLGSLGLWLMVARALSVMEKEASIYIQGADLRKILMHEFGACMKPKDIGFEFSLINSAAEKRFLEVKNVASELGRYTTRTLSKKPGDKNKARKLFDKFDGLLKAHDAGHIRYWRDWQLARWYVLAGDTKSAVPLYRYAFLGCMYRSGTNLKMILEEALAASALEKDKKALKQIKAAAASLGLFEMSDYERGDHGKHDAAVQDWEVEQLSASFSKLFPSSGMYPEAQKLKRSSGVSLMINPESVNKRMLDLRRPDRVISIEMLPNGKRHYPQLVWYASEGQTPEVKKLLEAGASVDLLKDDGGSALLCALQAEYEGRGNGVLEVLLGAKHTPKTLNTRTQKKGLTPLMLAIQHGDVETVGRLLNMGASADFLCGYPAIPGLYFCIGRYSLLSASEKTKRSMQQLRSSPMGSEVSRRYAGGFTGPLGDSLVFDDARFKEIEEMILDDILENLPYTADDLDRIVALLLEHGANPNEVSAYPDIGYSPLMLAAENNAANAFRMMLEKGGDPKKTNSQGNNSWRIALALASTDIYPMMRKNTDGCTLH